MTIALSLPRASSFAAASALLGATTIGLIAVACVAGRANVAKRVARIRLLFDKPLPA